MGRRPGPANGLGLRRWRVRIVYERGGAVVTYRASLSSKRCTVRRLCYLANEIVNSGTGKQPNGPALPCEGELSRLRSGGTVHRRLCYPHVTSAAVMCGGRGYWTNGQRICLTTGMIRSWQQAGGMGMHKTLYLSTPPGSKASSEDPDTAFLFFKLQY